MTRAVAVAALGFALFHQLSPSPRRGQVAAGGAQSVFLGPNGTLWVWGSGDPQPAPTVPSGVPGILSLAAGRSHTAILAADGTVWIWGSQGESQDRSSATGLLPTGLKDAAAISAAGDHTLAWKIDGSVWRWTPGELPAPVRGLPPVISIAAGAERDLAVGFDGTVWAWSVHAEPKQMAGLSAMVAVATGEREVAALRNDGTVWIQAAEGGRSSGAEPRMVEDLTGVIALAEGAEHGLALLRNGKVVSWGSNRQGQLGDGSHDDWAHRAEVRDLEDVVAIAAGDRHSLALKSDGSLWGWGDNTAGQLAKPSTLARSNVRVRISLDAGIATATPTFNPGQGTYDPPIDVAINCATQGAIIRYTTNGQPPTQSSPVYTSPIHITETTTLKAKAWAGVVNPPSEIATATYTMRVATPTFSPAPGTWFETLNVSLETATDGDTIHYTTNNDPPTCSSPVYTGPIAVTQSTTIKAIGCKTNWANSNEASGRYDLKVVTPTFNPPGNLPGETYDTDKVVAITTATQGATLYYTTNGDDPNESSTPYVGPISVNTNPTILKARGFKGGWIPSEAAVAEYRFKVATPSLSLPEGSYAGTQTVTVTTASPGVTLHYSTNGDEPKETDPVVVSGGTVEVDRSMTLKAKGWRTTWITSDTAKASYWLNLGTVDTPVLTPAPGLHPNAVTVEIQSDTPGAIIRFTTDGTEPGFSSPVYTGPIELSTTTDVRARAFKADMIPSGTAGGLYRIDLGTVDPPRFTGAAPGTYTTFRNVTVTSETPGATIHYTFDGREPTETDPGVASGETVLVGESMVLRTRAFKNGMPPSPVTQGLYRITGSVAAGMRHVLALKADGTVWAWGYNDSWELGDPNAGPQRAVPGQVPGLADVVAIAAGDSHSLALTRAGKVWAWGNNTYGQVGGTTNPAAPLEINPLAEVVAVAAGGEHSVALKRDGTVYIWGWDHLTSYGSAPVHVAVLAGVAQIAAGWGTLALKTDGASSGQLWSWGDNLYGNLGDGTKTNRSAPVAVAGMANAVAQALSIHGLALDATGQLWSWGNNSFGQLGNGSDTERLTPGTVPGLAGIAAVRTGYANSFVLDVDGEAFAWGYNAQLGLLGTGDANDHPIPTPVVAPEPMSVLGSLSRTSNEGIAVSPSGHVLVWGSGYYGQFGNGQTGVTSTIPLVVPDFSVTSNSQLTADTDGDGLSNEEEFALGSDPSNADTNADGIPDGIALKAGISLTNTDMDGDGLSNADEATKGTDPFIRDTDGDGHDDGPDCFPLDPTRWECPVPDPGDQIPPLITLQEPTNAILISTVPPE